MKKRILIVEDNITLSQIVRDWLEREGYAVTTAIDEPYARKLLRKESFDLILSDVRLPQGDCQTTHYPHRKLLPTMH